MQTTYRFNTSATDPVLCAQLPQQLHDDLTLKAEENGHSVAVELMIRLSKSLESDAQMQAHDDLIEKIFTVSHYAEDDE